MWSAVNWLSQKAGINLDDANEVLNCSDSFSANNQQSTDVEEQSNEVGKENQAGASNGSYNTPAGSKRSRRSPRWIPGANGTAPGNMSNPPHLGLASPPITPIVVPSGVAGSFRTSNGNGQLSHPAMPPIMVPTGPRNTSAGYSTLTGLVSSSVSPTVMHNKSSSPTSFSAWKDVSMAADVNSPGFAFRIVRQAEKQAELGSRNYPTVQEKYLHAKHLPNIKLRGSPKPVLTPLKPRSVPLLPLASPSALSSEASALGPILPSAASPSTASIFPSPHSSSSIPDFRNTDYYANPHMRGSDGVVSGSVGRPLPSMHMNNNSIGLSGAATSVGLAPSITAPDYASLAIANSTVPVTAPLGRQSSDLNSADVYRPANGSNDLDQLLAENEQQEDPTSLQAVLAALGKSQSGKGVKRGRMAEYEDSGNKRQCSDSQPQTMNCITQTSVGDHTSINGAARGATSSSGGGEKRALDTSSCSSTSLNSSGHGSPCAKLPRTSPGETSLGQSPLYELTVSSSPSNSSVAAGLIDQASLRARYTLARQRIDLASGNVSVSETTTTTDSSNNAKVSPSPLGPKSARLFSSLNQSVGLGGSSGDGSDSLQDEDCPKKKKRCVNPWFASMSSSRKMLTQEQISQKMESELDGQHDSDDSDDKSSDDSDHLSEHSMVVNGSGDDEVPDGDEAVITSNNASPPTRAVTSADSSPRGATPRLVSLTAHRTDKKANNTRLKKMMGLLFNLTDEEIELSKAPPVTAPSTTSSMPPSLSVLSVPSLFNNAAATKTASTASDTIPSFTFPLKPAATIVASSSSDVAVSATFTLPTTTDKSTFAGVLASAFASISSGEEKEETSSALAGDATVSPDLSRAATVPVSSLATGASSVSASFTVALPNKAATVPTSDVPTSTGAASAALPSYFEAKKTSELQVSDEKTTSFLSAAPMFNFGASQTAASPTSASVNPLLANSNSQSNDGKIASGKFFTGGSPVRTTPLGTPIGSTTATSSQPTATVASSNLFSFATSAASGANSTGLTPSSIATTTAASAPPPLFSFGPTASSNVSNNFSTTSVQSAAPVAFGADTNKTAGEASLPPAIKPGGFSFGNTATITGCFGEASKVAQDQTQAAKPTSGFSFGTAPTANVVDSKQTPSAAKSLFSFGPSAGSATANPLLNTPTTNTQAGDSVVSAPTFSFGNKPAPVTSASTSDTSSTGMFSFGANPTTAPSSTGTAASFSFGPGAAGAKTSFGSSSTSASFTFTPKANNEKSDAAIAPGSTTNAPSGFLFGGGALAPANSVNAGTATSSASGQVASPFTFGSAATAASSTTKTSTAAAPAGASMFTFGSSGTNAPAGSGFGSTPATSASAIFGAITSTTTANNVAPPSFPATANTNPPAFGTAVASATTNTFGSFGASGSNPFAGAAAPSSAPNANASFTFGPAATAKPSKTVTFGASSAMAGSSPNVFGQAASQTQAASTGTNLFGQLGATNATAPTSNSIFGQTSSAATPQFGSGTFGQAAAVPAVQANQSSGAAPAGASPFQFGAAATGGNASTGSSGFAFGSTASAGVANAAPVFGATPVPSFGSAAPSSNPPPAFGSAASSNPPAFGATASSTVPSFGAAPAAATPSFGAPAGGAMPSFGASASPAPAMFQFSSGNPGTPQQQQQQQQANSFSAGPYSLGGQQLGSSAGQDPLNVFSVGGNNASAASRRPRVRAHRRNR